jgi:hypothetical protein
LHDVGILRAVARTLLEQPQLAGKVEITIDGMIAASRSDDPVVGSAVSLLDATHRNAPRW